MELTLESDAADHGPRPLAAEALLALAADPASRLRFSPLGAEKFLLLDAWAGELPEADRTRVATWLQQLACPTIGIAGPDPDDPVQAACDVVVATLDQAWPLIASVERTPLAATTFVQLLRTTQNLPLEAALLAESLAYATLQAGPEYQRWLAASRGTYPAAPPEAGPAVLLERERDGTLAITLNRPRNRNAMSTEVRDGLVEALQLLACDDSIPRARLAGHGRCFSTGGDLAEFGSVPDPATGHVVRSLVLPARLLAQSAARVTCRLHGACIGAGIELPSFAQHVGAAPDAYFQLPELRFGLIPGAGGCVGIPRRIGRQRTAWMVLSGKRIAARQALEWGLVDAIEAPAPETGAGTGA